MHIIYRISVVKAIENHNINKKCHALRATRIRKCGNEWRRLVYMKNIQNVRQRNNRRIMCAIQLYASKDRRYLNVLVHASD